MASIWTRDAFSIFLARARSQSLACIYIIATTFGLLLHVADVQAGLKYEGAELTAILAVAQALEQRSLTEFESVLKTHRVAMLRIFDLFLQLGKLGTPRVFCASFDCFLVARFSLPAMITGRQWKCFKFHVGFVKLS